MRGVWLLNERGVYHAPIKDGLDLTEREIKSERFNNMQPGDTVIIQHNNRTGHHDVTGKRAYLHNKVNGA